MKRKKIIKFKNNPYKLRWLQMINEVKQVLKKHPDIKVELKVILKTMLNIEKKRLSNDVVSSRFILQKYSDIDRGRLKYGRDKQDLPYEKKGGMFYYKERDIVLWWNNYSKVVQKKGK